MPAHPLAVKTALRLAKSQVGILEIPRGSNRGPLVDTYKAAVGFQASDPIPWCQAFACWIIKMTARELCVPCPVIMTASCDMFLYWGRREGLVVSEPKPGDFGLVMASRNDATHVYMVARHADGTVSTIEGNTNPSGGREGYGVFARQRRTSGAVFVRALAALPDSKPAPAEASIAGPQGDMEWGGLWAAGGTIMVPVRQFLEQLGRKAGRRYTRVPAAAIGWDDERSAVTINNEPLPVQVALIDGRAYAPARALGDALGWIVSYADNTVVFS